MDQWKKKSLREEQQFRQGTITSPSFSSTLLDSIYRSIDQGVEEEQKGFHRETMKKKQSNNNVRGGGGGGIERKEMDKWMMIMEKNKEIRRKSQPDFDRKVLMNHNDRSSSSMFVHSTSSSSDSSSGGGFSSSEAESVYESRSRSSSVPSQRPPKPMRRMKLIRESGLTLFLLMNSSSSRSRIQRSTHHENSFIKSFEDLWRFKESKATDFSRRTSRYFHQLSVSLQKTEETKFKFKFCRRGEGGF